MHSVTPTARRHLTYQLHEEFKTALAILQAEISGAKNITYMCDKKAESMKHPKHVKCMQNTRFLRM